MTKYLGIDYGTSMIKAAVCDRAAGTETLVTLETDDPYFPAAVELPTNASAEWICGSEAHAHRRLRPRSVATDFRDKLAETAARLELNGNAIAGTEVLAPLFKSLAVRLQETVPDIKAACVTVPDSWTPGAWSLPVALYEAGWRPQLLVREFAAVLASEAPAGDEAVLLSLGYGSLRATCAVRRDGEWKAESTASDPSVSGKLLRQRLSVRLADEMVKATRYNPQENSEADQALEDAIERVLRRLPFDERAELSLEMKGRSFQKQLLRSETAALVADFAATLEKLLEKLGVQSQSNPQIIAWGELTRLLPIDQWLSGWNLSLASPTCVAIGAARVCDWFGQRGDAANLPGVSMVDGTWQTPPWPHDVVTSFVPVLQSLPTEWTESVSTSRSTARLVQITPSDVQRTIELMRGSCRLGRHPAVEITFDSAAFPQVSQYHAQILFDGDRYVITDLGSTNGTFINDHPLKGKVPLTHGDVIRLGQDHPQLRFESKP